MSQPLALFLGPGTYGKSHEARSCLASYRLRVLPFLQTLTSLGWACALPSTVSEACEILATGEVRLIYVGKWDQLFHEAADFCFELFNLINNPPSEMEPIFRVVDICENSSVDENEWRSRFFDYWIEHGDLYLASSQELLEEVVLPRMPQGRKAVVVPDITEEVMPCSDCIDLNAIGWFGHVTNLHELIECLLESPNASMRLVILTRLDQSKALLAKLQIEDQLKGCWPLLQWRAYRGPGYLAEDLADCHSIVIPVDLANPRKRYGSHNRLTTSLLLGKEVFASPLPSYLPFQQFATLVDDPLAACLNAVVGEKQPLLSQKGLHERLQEFSPATVGKLLSELVRDHIQPECLSRGG